MKVMHYKFLISEQYLVGRDHAQGILIKLQFENFVGLVCSSKTDR